MRRGRLPARLLGSSLRAGNLAASPPEPRFAEECYACRPGKSGKYLWMRHAGTGAREGVLPGRIVARATDIRRPANKQTAISVAPLLELGSKLVHLIDKVVHRLLAELLKVVKVSEVNSVRK